MKNKQTINKKEKISQHFTYQEISCKCLCGFGYKKGDLDNSVVVILELIRNHFKKPVLITSGLRCEKHNKNVGGVKNSTHTKGLAVDIKIDDITPQQISSFLDFLFPNCLGIGTYKTFTHINKRADKSYRWKE